MAADGAGLHGDANEFWGNPLYVGLAAIAVIMCMLLCCAACALDYLYNARNQHEETNASVSGRDQQEDANTSVSGTDASSDAANLLTSEDLRDYAQTSGRGWEDLENPTELMGNWKERDQALLKQIQEQTC